MSHFEGTICRCQISINIINTIVDLFKKIYMYHCIQPQKHVHMIPPTKTIRLTKEIRFDKIIKSSNSYFWWKPDTRSVIFWIEDTLIPGWVLPLVMTSLMDGNHHLQNFGSKSISFSRCSKCSRSILLRVHLEDRSLSVMIILALVVDTW